jgi:predicted dehydrogenase/threonine dehydrogenase-like Zn-dependent dehydrogenase
MKQIVQSLRTGTIEVAAVPSPFARRGELVMRTRATLISAGTERMLLEFGKAGWIEKARQQPDKVRQVLDKIRTDGFLATLQAVRNKLDQPLPLGYCHVGTVIGMGDGVTGFAVGDRVTSNGKHAEVVAVPATLCAKVPATVSDEAAAFTVLGAVALEGIRLVQTTLGETVVVTGLGLVGLLTVQLLRAHGCRVLGVDLDAERLAFARGFGAEVVNVPAGEDPVKAAEAFSRGRGVDAVLITASTTSSEPVRRAARMCRKRGRIVLVGVTGLDLSRADFYEKELSFQVSCSYGPGRYDPNYEDKGQDYPVGFVRWTAHRNFEAVLDLLADRRLDIAPLISHRFRVEEAERAYDLLSGGAPSLGILLEYPSQDGQPEESLLDRTVRLSPEASRAPSGSPVVGFIGAGQYGGHVLIPAFARTGAILHTVATSGGLSGVHVGRRYGFHQASTDRSALLADPAITTVVIATRHDTHARLVCEALQAGKHVFVEKPLCLTLDELTEIEQVYSALSTQHSAPPLLMVGFNRRFAPHVQKIKGLLDGVKEPKSFILTVNAGRVPGDHWTQDPDIGGGRILGEACHFVDLLRDLAGAPITDARACYLGGAAGAAGLGDTATFTLRFADGSFGTVQYLANGHRSFPKERLDVFCAGRILQLDNFRALRGYGWPGFRTIRLWRQDKGHTQCAAAFVDAIRTRGPAPIPVDELFEISRVTIQISQQRHRPLP